MLDKVKSVTQTAQYPYPPKDTEITRSLKTELADNTSLENVLVLKGL